MPQQWQTVAIPFAAGIKPTSRGRTLDQAKLLTAQNCFYATDEGPQKRYGHTAIALQTDAPPPGLNDIVLPSSLSYRAPYSFTHPVLSDNWLHGYGLIENTSADSKTPGEFTISAQPRLGYAFGGFQRDSEIVSWDGFRAISATLNNTPFAQVNGQAVMPALHGAPIAKSINGQYRPDGTDNGVLRSVAWVFNSDVYRSVYASDTQAPVVIEEPLGFTGASGVRLITAGAWTHAVIQDTNIDELVLRSWHQDTPNEVISRSLGECTSVVFDVRKIDEDRLVVARILAGNIEVSLLRDYGEPYGAYTITPLPGDVAGSVTAVGVSIAPYLKSTLGVLFQNADSEMIFTAVGLEDGVVSVVQESFTVCNAQCRFTISDNYLFSGIYDAWTLFIEDSATIGRKTRVYAADNLITLKTTRYGVQLASHAFRVGGRAYVWVAGSKSVFTLQPTWFLCDEQLMPVGKVLFGLAYVPDATEYTLPSVTWRTETSADRLKDTVVFFGALGYRQRANTEAAVGDKDPNGVWAEPSAFYYSLDFLPPLRSAQAGRSTYIAGAQLWEYDGASLNEAGFHMAPEGWTVTDGGAGTLDETKQYNWRIDLCYKNAQNEEVRSWSKTVAVVANAFGASTFKATITIPHMPMTRRDGAYFLVFRTEGDGTEYYLVSSRDPTSPNFVANSRASVSYTFTDDTPDAALIDNEYHPANAVGYIQPLPAPACELVTAGRDRLWLAGGELSPGEIAPSRYFGPGETPSFSPALSVQVDRNAAPITAIGFVGEQAVFFRKYSTYTQDSDGPDNVAQGVWAPPRLALSDVGAVAQETLALAGEGLYFQSPAGIRVITSGGGLRPPGAGLIGGLGTDVDTLAVDGNYAAAVVVPQYSQIRWYSRDSSKPTIVVDYTKNIWTTFTGLECTFAGYWIPGSAPVLMRGAGALWREVPGRYVDDDLTYEMVVKTSWLHGANLGDFSRIKRFALFGEASDGLSLRFRVYYDEREFHEQEETVGFISDLQFNPSVWGDEGWGQGTWGDALVYSNTSTNSHLYFRDSKFRLRRRFDRQKCSVFALEFSDQGSQAEFTPVVLALELGLKSGLDRTS